MIIPKVGLLYKTDYNLFIYSSITAAERSKDFNANPVARSNQTAAQAVTVTTNFWFEDKNFLIDFLISNKPFLIFEQKQKNKELFFHIIHENKQNWIIFKDWLNLKEIKNS